MALIQPVITHYRVPLYNRLARFPDLDIVCFHSRGSETGVPEVNANLPFKGHKAPILYNPFSGQALYQALIWNVLTGGFDVVICTQQINNLSPLILWSLRGIFRYKFIWWGIGFDPYRLQHPGDSPKTLGGVLLVSVKDFIFKRADAQMVYSQEGKEYSVRIGINPQQVFVLHNTLDVQELRTIGESLDEGDIQSLRGKLGIDNKAFVFSFLGRLHKRKNVPFLIEAFAMAKRSCTKAKLLIVGDGEERDKVAQSILAHGLQSDAIMLGEIYNNEVLAKLFRISDVVVLPGQAGLAICHAFAYGRPILTRLSSSYSPELEYLKDNVNGVLIRDKSLQAYAEAMSTVYHDPQLLKRLSEAAWATGCEMSMDRMASRFRDAILYAVGRNPLTYNPGEMPPSASD